MTQPLTVTQSTLSAPTHTHTLCPPPPPHPPTHAPQTLPVVTVTRSPSAFVGPSFELVVALPAAPASVSWKLRGCSSGAREGRCENVSRLVIPCRLWVWVVKRSQNVQKSTFRQKSASFVYLAKPQFCVLCPPSFSHILYDRF